MVERPGWKETIEQLEGNMAFRRFKELIQERYLHRVNSLVRCEARDVELLRGRSQELADLMKELGTKNG